jgi:hypothetical protein
VRHLQGLPDRFILERMIRILLFCLLTLPLVAADDTPCNAALRRVAGVRGAEVKVCIVTDRLVPNRTVIFAVLNFDESSENFGNLVVVLDAKAAAAGRREKIIEDQGAGIDLEPFLFRGRKTLAAIADFDRSGRIGWAIVYRADTASVLTIQRWDPAAAGFLKVGPWARNDDGWYPQDAFYMEGGSHGAVEIGDGKIRLPLAHPVTYLLEGGRYVPASEAVKLPETAAVCGKRATCRVVTFLSAGKSAAGQALTVVQLSLGLKDKPGDAPDEGCRDGSGGHDGGSEYWLLAASAQPRLLLALCNDGYGAAGVGEDEVQVAENRLIYTQSGGSNDRWSGTRTVQLAPSRLLAIDSCGYRATTPGSGVASRADIAHMMVRSVAQDDRDPAMRGADPGCPAFQAGWNAQPGPGLVAGVAVPLASEESRSKYPPGAPLGDCALRLGTAGAPGFAIYGTPIPERRAELRVAALDRQSVVIQLYDPRPGAPGANWVQSDHLEIWTGKDASGMHNHPEAAQTAQIGIALDGKVYAGLGSPALPVVTRTAARDEAGRPVQLYEVRWKAADALAAGVAVVYSQAEEGRQSYVVSTSGIARNRPLYLPALGEIPVSCGLVDGRWSVAGNTGELQ